MLEGSYHFPKGFLWGTATSSHQVEGGNVNNNWHRWEQESGKVFQNQTSGIASDWWSGRWTEDFERAYEDGHTAHRFSVEWSRIQPYPGKWDQAALDQYRAMATWLNQHNMTPMITLHHCTDPLWLTEIGGWENDDTPDLFNDLVKKVVENLQDLCGLWCTINEPNVYAVDGYVFGDFPPGKSDIGAAFRVLQNMIKAHVMAYHTIHSLQPEAKVGFTIQYTPMQPRASWSPLDNLFVKIFGWAWNDSFAQTIRSGVFRFLNKKASLPEAINTMDYMGVNYYFIQQLFFSLRSPMFVDRRFPLGTELSPSGDFGNTPQGIFLALKWARSFDLPIYITENGIEDAADNLRPRYLIQHLHQTWRAVNFCWKIKGYFHWSLVDNFEWQAGWSQRFGLYGLDLATQKRARTTSAEIYSSICKENGITSDLVQKYTPEIYEKIFPQG